LTQEYIKQRLNVLFDADIIGANYPLEGENGIMKFLFSPEAVLDKRRIDNQFKAVVSAHKQAGAAVQDKEAFLAHAKKFGTVSKLLNAEKENEAPKSLSEVTEV
jgi:hypothetical protein